MSLFNTIYSEFNLRRDEVLFRQVETSKQFISNLLLYRKRQISIENQSRLKKRKKIRIKIFYGSRKSNKNRIRVKKDILDWSIGRIPLT
jgi:hypothetical protein